MLLHTEAFKQRSLHTEETLHTEALHRGVFIQRPFYTQKFSHYFAQRSLHTEELLHTEAVTESLYTEELLHTEAFTKTQKLLHREAFKHRNFYTEKSLHTETFTQKRLYTEKLLHTEAFAQRSLYAEELLDRETFTQRHFFTQKLWNWEASKQEGPLHIEAFLNTQRCFYTQQKFLHREVCVKSLYTQNLLHRGVYTQEPLHTEACTQKPWHTEKSLHRGAFTRRGLVYIEKSLCKGALHLKCQNRNFSAAFEIRPSFRAKGLRQTFQNHNFDMLASDVWKSQS